MSTSDFPFFLSRREHYAAHSAAGPRRPTPRLLAVDWKQDLFRLPWYPGFEVTRVFPLQKITRLAINLDDSACYKFSCTKDLLDTFPAMEHLTIVFDGNFREACRELHGYDVITPIRYIAKNAYYFSPSPQKTADEFLLRVYSRGSMDRTMMEGCFWESWPISAELLDENDFDIVGKEVEALKPGIQVEAVLDTTILHMWEQ
ncbi:hypothetical protein F5Y16DRAFT_419797 [Xylariaceae sp. FL0255]|nr:hypothetical protein F5Y16DRAFT_419797 [Xylariaceae sp. FL0255]